MTWAQELRDTLFKVPDDFVMPTGINFKCGDKVKTNSEYKQIMSCPFSGEVVDRAVMSDPDPDSRCLYWVVLSSGKVELINGYWLELC